MRFALHHDFAGFATKELEDRKAAFYPPFCKLVEVSFGSKDEQLLRDAVERVEKMCRAEKSVMVLGPVDAFIPKILNVHWAKLYLKTNDLAAVRRILGPVVNSPKPWAAGVEIKVEIE
jgi:primosomal protein N' (replication factor Y)